MSKKLSLESLLSEGQENVQETVITESVVETSIPVIDYDSILTEWSYRCDSGSPVYGKHKDMIHLQNILDENNIPLPFERITEAPVAPIAPEFTLFYSLLTPDKKEKFDIFIATMPINLLAEFKKTVKAFKLQDAKFYAEFFKSVENVDVLNKVKYDKYMKLWETYVGQAIGKGELFISFAVDKAVVQGSSESFDIADGEKHYEVKSLDVLDSKSGRYKYGQIRPGAEGKVSKYLFTKQLMEFYSLVKQLKAPDTRAAVMMLGKEDAMSKIYDVIDSISIIKPKGGDALENPGDIPASMMDNVYNNALILHKIKTLPLNKDVTTSRIAVKGSTADSSYWISPEDADEIAKTAGKEKPISIKVGAAVSDETKEGKIVLADLFNHPFVKTPKTFTDGLYEIKMAFFGNKAGLIYFLNQETVVSPKMAEFATTESSQDGYRFGLKSRNKGKAYIEDQK